MSSKQSATSTTVIQPREMRILRSQQGWKNLFVVAIGIIFLLSSVIVYVLVNKDAPLSVSIVKNTPLNGFIDLPLLVASENEDEEARPKIINRVLGLESSALNPYKLADVLIAEADNEQVEKVNQNTVIIRNTQTNQSAHAVAMTQYGVLVSASNNLKTCNQGVIVDAGQDSFEVINGEDRYEVDRVYYDQRYGVSLWKTEDKEWNTLNFLDPKLIEYGDEAISINKNQALINNTLQTGEVTENRTTIDIGADSSCDGQQYNASNLISYSETSGQSSIGHPVLNSAGQLFGLYKGVYGDVGYVVPGDVLVSILDNYRSDSLDSAEQELPFTHRPILFNAEAVGEYAGRSTILIENIDTASTVYKNGLRDGDVIVGINDNIFEYDAIIQNPLESYLLTNTLENSTLKVLKQIEFASYEKVPTNISTAD